MEYNQPGLMMAHLLFEEEVAGFSTASLATHLAGVLGPAHPVVAEADSLQYFFPRYTSRIDGQDIALQATAVISSEAPSAGDYRTAVQQSWHWPGVQLGRCRSRVVVSDLTSRGVPYSRRVDFFHRLVLAFSRGLKPAVVYVAGSDKLLSPATFEEIVAGCGFPSLFACVNVRSFALQEKIFLMDTVGMHVLGLWDFEVLFTGGDRNKVARTLYGCCEYVYEKGMAIRDGDFVPGAAAGSSWRCRFRASRLQPSRQVIALVDER